MGKAKELPYTVVLDRCNGEVGIESSYCTQVTASDPEHAAARAIVEFLKLPSLSGDDDGIDLEEIREAAQFLAVTAIFEGHHVCQAALWYQAEEAAQDTMIAESFLLEPLVS